VSALEILDRWRLRLADWTLRLLYAGGPQWVADVMQWAVRRLIDARRALGAHDVDYFPEIDRYR
jgi:hypothetical protein